MPGTSRNDDTATTADAGAINSRGYLAVQSTCAIVINSTALFVAPTPWRLQIELCNSGTGTPHCTVGVLKLHNISRATRMMTGWPVC
jgi:hypothetical protein